jgi:hypothetical protein
MNARTRFAVLAILLLALLVSCGDDSVTDSGPPYSRATPEDLIEALAYSIKEKDTDIYTECLHDEFLFTFLSRDAEDMGLPPAEPWWGKTEDVKCMNNMFTESTVKDIECVMLVYSGPLVDDGIMAYRLELSLKVPIFEEGEPEGIIMWANHSWLDVEIVVDPYASDKWVFKAMEEVWKDFVAIGSAPGGRNPAEYSSFGSIKAMFRVEDF